MPTWCRIATCSIRPRMEASSLNTAPPAFMTNTLFLYMRMYGAALRSARTATDGSGRFLTIEFLRSSGSLGQHAVQDRGLHHQPIECLEFYRGARAVEDLVRHRDIAAHGQAVHELGVRLGRGEPALVHAPVLQSGAQARIRFGVAVVRGRAPFLRVNHMRALERRRAVRSLRDRSA